MKAVIIFALLCVGIVSAISVTPGDVGVTIMQPSAGGDASKGETVLTAAPQQPLTGNLRPATIEAPTSNNVCGCCNQANCGCCGVQQPQFIAPEMKEPPSTCGCQPTCATPGSCMCPNNCGCCSQTIAPEIKDPITTLGSGCNCCHLDSCGCCKIQTITPEQKVVHVAPEIVEKPACPCQNLQVASCACRV